MELLNWVPSNKLAFTMLQANPNAIDHIEKYHIPKMWTLLSENPGALCYMYNDPTMLDNAGYAGWLKNPNPAIIPLLEKYVCIKVPYVQERLLENPNALHLVDTRYIEGNLHILAKNTSLLAMQLIEDYIDDLSDVAWERLSANPSAIHILEKNLHKVDWVSLCANPAAIHLLLKLSYRISWFHFSKNTHPLAIVHMRKNLEKVNWHNLSANPAAIELLKENQDKISWYWLSKNPAIFEYNYSNMAKARTDVIREELLAVALHPDRVCAWLQEGITLADL
jgi:hypothetical protein